MNFLDIFIVIILVYGIIKGIIRGFVLQSFSILGVIIGIYFSILYVGRVSLWVSHGIDISLTYARPISYFIIFCAVILSFHLVAKLLDKSIKVSLVSWVNKLLGAVLGLLKYALVLSIFLHVFQAMDKNEKVLKHEKKANSLLYYPVFKIVPKLMPYVDADFLKK